MQVDVSAAVRREVVAHGGVEVGQIGDEGRGRDQHHVVVVLVRQVLVASAHP